MSYQADNLVSRRARLLSPAGHRLPPGDGSPAPAVALPGAARRWRYPRRHRSVGAMPDPFDLARFVTAQEPVLEQVRRELAAGAKRSHWMWFVFPQLKGLGHSAIARHYGIASLQEAHAYLAHPLLGPRLLDCTGLVVAVQGRTINQILGSPDDLKFRSSMTLFAAADPARPIFADALARYFAGAPDILTLERLPAAASPGPT